MADTSKIDEIFRKHDPNYLTYDAFHAKEAKAEIKALFKETFKETADNSISWTEHMKKFSEAVERL